MNCSARRHLESRESVEYALALRNEGAQFAGLRVAQKSCEVRTSNKDRLLGRGDNHAFDRTVVLDCIKLFGERAYRRSVENVRAGIRPIEGEHADAVPD